jgi:hypothetical protein
MGHRSQATLGRLEMMQQLQRMVQAMPLENIPWSIPAFLEDYCMLVSAVWYAASMGRRCGRVVDP